MRIPALLAAALLAALAAAPAGAASKPAKKPAPASTDLKFDSAEEYGACMTLARTKPGDGFESALAWQSRGGGEAAEHCAAVALIEAGETAEGAKRMEALGTRMARISAASAGRFPAILVPSAWPRPARPG